MTDARGIDEELALDAAQTPAPTGEQQADVSELLVTGSLNHTQMVADEDGRFAYVVSHRDTGVHGRLDTGGLRITRFGHRWQAIPKNAKPATPSIGTSFDDQSINSISRLSSRRNAS